MKSLIFYILFLSIPFSIIYFYSCGSDIVTSTTQNSNCGPHHNVRYPGAGEFDSSDYTFTTVDANNKRVFQFSAIPFTTITNVCTKSKPKLDGLAGWVGDTSRGFRVLVHADIGGISSGYTDLGGYLQSGLDWSWLGSTTIGLIQAYGNGPGEITDMRVDVKFLTFGSLAQDQNYLEQIRFECHMTLDYDEYRATTDGGSGWLQPVFPEETRAHFFAPGKRENVIEKIVKGDYLISDERKIYFDYPLMKLD